MALLMYAIRWEEIVPRRTVSLPADDTKRQSDLRSESHGSTLEELHPGLEDSKLEEKTPAVSEKACRAHDTPIVNA